MTRLVEQFQTLIGTVKSDPRGQGISGGETRFKPS